jgi:hypothetical protein
MIYDNSSGVNMRVWTGSTQPGFSTAVTGGTLRIAHTGATVSAYLNSALVWSSTWTTGRLVGAADGELRQKLAERLCGAELALRRRKFGQLDRRRTARHQRHRR